MVSLNRRAASIFTRAVSKENVRTFSEVLTIVLR